MSIHPALDFEKSFVHSLQNVMLEAAEPLIDEAVEKIRQSLRERVNKMCVGMIEQEVSFERLGHNLRITVALAKPK